MEAVALRTTRAVLAAAHLNHAPRDSRLRNLRALCQRCHLLHDRPHHRAQRWRTLCSRWALGDLFLGLYDWRPATEGSALDARPANEKGRPEAALAKG